MTCDVLNSRAFIQRERCRLSLKRVTSRTRRVKSPHLAVQTEPVRSVPQQRGWSAVHAWR